MSQDRRVDISSGDLWSAANWFAIQAKPGLESIAAESIASLDLETFLPRACRDRTIGRVVRSSIKPLFPGYLFAHFNPGLYLHLVRYCRGVCRVVSAGEKPLPVEENIISEIRQRIGTDGWVRLESRAWRPGEIVEINEGPFRGCSAIFERELDDHHRVVVLLKAIHQARVVMAAGDLSSAERV